MPSDSVRDSNRSRHAYPDRAFAHSVFASPQVNLVTRILLILALISCASLSLAAVSDHDDSTKAKTIGVLAIEAFGVAPQLATRLRGIVLEALKSEGLRTYDLVDTHSFIADCNYLTDCLTATLGKLDLDYVVLVKLVPSATASSARPEHEITVNLGRMPRGLSVWGPWPMSTVCRDCSDTELTDAVRQLASSTWKAMLRAELPLQDIEINAQDRRSRGANLIKLASDGSQSTFDQIYLLKRAIHAGAGRSAFLELAKTFFECRGYAEAEDYASKAAAKGEKVDSLMARLFWYTGRWWDALPMFQKLAQAAPKDERLKRIVEELSRRTQDSRSIISQAEAELKRDDLSKANQLARIALATRLHGTKLRLILAAASLRTFGYADALAQFLAVLDADPSNTEARAGKKQAEDGLRQTREMRMRRRFP
jgi:hypothetical protein